ncbi:hypothetical protein LCD36_04630 [Saccharopolyspora sp. 6T]|uniref:hypothetical protein n=1 Tax=Saccharopolyspora sp. 6T TaxID=2877238 RepID=UPI001CD4D0F8|nr:hypothetical protein [Saccharopolyspora sp. 6T]MCA1185738.1 hypothetical protein [Saccharopolyspora sp. 6T]
MSTTTVRGTDLQPGMTVRDGDGHQYVVTHVLGGSVFGRSADDAANRDWRLGADIEQFVVIEED